MARRMAHEVANVTKIVRPNHLHCRRWQRKTTCHVSFSFIIHELSLWQIIWHSNHPTLQDTARYKQYFVTSVFRALRMGYEYGKQVSIPCPIIAHNCTFIHESVPFVYPLPCKSGLFPGKFGLPKAI